MNIKTSDSLFNNDREFLTILEGITKDDVMVKSSITPKNEEVVDSKYSFDRTNWITVYVVLKPEIVEVLESLNPILLKCFTYSGVMSENEKTYNLHETKRFDFKFTGIRTRKKKVEKYNDVYQNFLDSKPRITEVLTTELLSKVNDYLKNTVEGVNEKYTRNHVELFTSDTYKKSWENDFNSNEELVNTIKEKEELAKQIKELNTKMSSLDKKITTIKCEITKDELSKEELPSEVVEKINEKYAKGEAWRIYGTRGLRLS